MFVSRKYASKASKRLFSPHHFLLVLFHHLQLTLIVGFIAPMFYRTFISFSITHRSLQVLEPINKFPLPLV